MSRARPPERTPPPPGGTRREATLGGDRTRRARVVPATGEAIAEAVSLLRAGELVAFPTETVYGLGADASNPAAVRAVFAAKGRPADHPLIVHLATADRLDQWASAVPVAARQLAERFWPGPLTLILRCAEPVSREVTGGQATVGLRVPSHPVAHRLLAAFGGGVAAPSANRFGRVSPTRAAHVASELGDAVALILDGGDCEVGIESTIVDFTSHGEQAVMLRPGGVGVEALAEVLGYVPLPPTGAAPRASGTLASHYAPSTPTLAVPTALLDATIARALDQGLRVGLLAMSGPARPGVGAQRIGGADARGYARSLYRNLRALDSPDVDLIVVESPPATTPWLAVNDRLQRATRRDDEAP